jgi:hypothetical protein
VGVGAREALRRERGGEDERGAERSSLRHREASIPRGRCHGDGPAD